MYVITDVDFLEYYSNNIPKDILSSYLIGSKCNSGGKIRLTLKPGKEFTQEGPYILPPIRWLDSFEYYAEFVISCDVKEVYNNNKDDDE